VVQPVHRSRHVMYESLINAMVYAENEWVPRAGPKSESVGV